MGGNTPGVPGCLRKRPVVVRFLIRADSKQRSIRIVGRA